MYTIHYAVFFRAFFNYSYGNTASLFQIEAPNTTLLEWAPDGQHLMTATTAPRLRIDNSFRIWHYTGRLLYERRYDYPSELWQVVLQR